MVKEKAWQEFRNSGLLWFTNSILHVFGWAIVVEFDEETKDLVRAYPARVKYRGFSEESTTHGHKRLSKYIKENAEILEQEANE